MRTIWRSLLWREWHEHKWKLAALSAILLTVQVYMGFESGSGGVTPVMFWFLCMVPGAFFIALGTATGERAAHTLEFVRALPIKTWQAAAVKLGMATVVCLLPLAFSALAALAWGTIGKMAVGEGARQIAVSGTNAAPEMLLQGLVAAGLVISVLFWVTATAIGQPNELRASAAGAVLLCGWVAVSALAAAKHDVLPPGARKIFLECLVAVGPGGFLLLSADDAHPALDLVLQLSSLAAVAAWTLRCFGRLGVGDNRSPGAAVATHGAAPTLAGTSWRPLTAIAWKQWREAAPLCLAGFAFVAGFAVIRAIVMKDSPLTGAGATTLRATILWTGALTAMIVGVGSFTGDLQPGIWAFWRSRPISPAAWFWTKYVSGAAAVLLFLDGPLVAINLLGSRGPVRSLTTDTLLDCSLALHLLAYTFAVCASCWVRQGVYAGILSIAAVLTVVSAPVRRPSLAWLDLTKILGAMDRGGFADGLWFRDAYLPFAAGMAALTLAAALLAWCGVGREQGLSDWGWGLRSALHRFGRSAK